MLFFKTAIAALAAATLVSALPPRWSSFDAEMCHFVGEPCDRPEGQCCPWLKCNLGNYECEEPRAHNKLIQSNEMCYGPGYPCGSYSECCSNECYMGTCLPDFASPRRAHKLIQSNEMCHFIGEPCDRPQGQCCPGLQCNLDYHECEEPYDAHKNAMCHNIREPCDRPQGQCCPGLQCNLNKYECEPRRAHNKLFKSNEMCTPPGLPCDFGPCCSGQCIGEEFCA